jgi:hypothetical protein
MARGKAGVSTMTNPKEAGGWGREVPDQPAGTKDRTFGTREALPRDVDEGFGRHVKPDRGEPVRVRANRAQQSPKNGTP